MYNPKKLWRIKKTECNYSQILYTCILCPVEHREHFIYILLYYGENELISSKIASNFDSSNTSNKRWNRSCLLLCNILHFSNNCINICELRRSVTGAFGEDHCPILVWRRILAAQQFWAFSAALLIFIMYQLPGEKSGLQAGQFRTWTFLLRSQTVVIDATCGFALSCWNMQVLPWKRCCLDGSISCTKISVYTDSAFLRVEAAHVIGTNATPYHQRCRLLNSPLIRRWMVPLLFGPQDTASMLSKNNFWFIWPQNSFPFCLKPF